MSKNLQRGDGFSPTPSMILWLDTAINLLTTNISEIASACKVSRQAWYLWTKQQQFIDWFDEEWQKRLKGAKWKLDVMALNKAATDYRYWEGMANRLGMLPKDSREEEPTNVTFTWMKDGRADEEKKQNE